MDDLNDTLCTVLQEITHYTYESVIEFSDGAFLPLLLEQIDSNVFNSHDQSLANWKRAEERLENFLESKKLSDRGLDFSIKDIEDGDFDSIVGAILQILAIFVTFNKPKWEQIMKSVGFVTFTHITKLLEDMVKGLREILEMSNKPAQINHNEMTFRSLLNKLETKEELIEKMSKEVKQLKDKLAKELQEKVEMTEKLKKYEVEILEVSERKDKVFEDYVNEMNERMTRHDVSNGSEQLLRSQNELKVLTNKLNKALSDLVDRDCEIDKLSSLSSILEQKSSENDEIKRQLEHYQTTSNEVKLMNEYLQSKLNSLSNVDVHIKNINQKLKEEKEANMKLQKQLDEASPLIENLQRRVEFLENRRPNVSGNLTSNSEFGDLYSLEFHKILETENQQYRKQIEELRTILKNNELKNFSDSILEEENKALRAQIDSFFASGVFPGTSVQMKVDRVDDLELVGYPDHLFKNEHTDEQKVTSLGQLPTGDFPSDGAFQEKTSKNNRSKDDFQYCDVLYTTLMEFYKYELASQKKYVLSRPERERNIMKQFFLQDLLQNDN